MTASAGQAASALHATAFLQVHQAKTLKEQHEGSSEPGLVQELQYSHSAGPRPDDAHLGGMGWGAICNGHVVSGSWTGP